MAVANISLKHLNLTWSEADLFVDGISASKSIKHKTWKFAKKLVKVTEFKLIDTLPLTIFDRLALEQKCENLPNYEN